MVFAWGHDFVTLLCFGFSGTCLCAGLYLCRQSLRERESRAAWRFLAVAVAASVACAFLGALDFPGRNLVATILLAAPLCLLAALLVPTRSAMGNEIPRERVDERDIPFSRRRLPGMPQQAAQYYALRPEKEAVDALTRSACGMFSPKSAMAHPLVFPGAAAMRTLLAATTEDLADPPPAPATAEFDAATLTRFVKGWARYLGAHSVGIVRLAPHHVYSHSGYRDLYGKKHEVEHKFAVAMTTPQDRGMIRTAPRATAMMETYKGYQEGAFVALQMAEFCRKLGYAARPHVFENYRIVAPLVARDAGLGELGRMGLLVTPDVGPMVRICVVTTDMPLNVDPRAPNASVFDFCARCRKCAEACPVKAIPLGPPSEDNGVLRWKIDHDACFRYWCTSGASCGRCVAVCPYGHPDAPMHRAVRFFIRRSALARRLGLTLDDFFYGRVPASLDPPDWTELPKPALPRDRA